MLTDSAFPRAQSPPTEHTTVSMVAQSSRREPSKSPAAATHGKRTLISTRIMYFLFMVLPPH